jgi:hypothetical protein
MTCGFQIRFVVHHGRHSAATMQSLQRIEGQRSRGESRGKRQKAKRNVLQESREVLCHQGGTCEKTGVTVWVTRSSGSSRIRIVRHHALPLCAAARSKAEGWRYCSARGSKAQGTEHAQAQEDTYQDLRVGGASSSARRALYNQLGSQHRLRVSEEANVVKYARWKMSRATAFCASQAGRFEFFRLNE